jgi:hypothetical protein
VSGRLWALDPASFGRHAVHQGDRAWPDSNCSVDVWIELLHAAGLEPMAALPFTIATDFEGDQWTFFKIPYADLQTLYGVDVVELNVWRPLATHIADQLTRGRPSIVEVDAFHLPDTAGTSYQREHVKTSIAVQAIDCAAKRLGYFHNAGYYELGGSDFTGLFGAADSDPRVAPACIEVAKFNHRPIARGGPLVRASIELLHAHLRRLPRSNPFRRYAPRLVVELESLALRPFEDFHRYAFATFRQFGSAFELTGEYLRWLTAAGESGLGEAAAACGAIAATAKALQLKTARLVSSGRSFDAIAMVDTMADAWDAATIRLSERYRAVAYSG